MLTNTDQATGYAYGVVALNSLADWVFDEFWYDGVNLTMAAVEEEAHADHPEWEGILPDEFWDGIALETESYSLTKDGLCLELSYLGGAPLVWVFKSPHTTLARPCSPCCPGAGDLDNKDATGIPTYDLPPEWYLCDFCSPSHDSATHFRAIDGRPICDMCDD